MHFPAPCSNVTPGCSCRLPMGRELDESPAWAIALGALSADPSDRRRLLAQRWFCSVSAASASRSWVRLFDCAHMRKAKLVVEAPVPYQSCDRLQWASNEEPRVLVAAIRSTQAYLDAAVTSRDRNGFLQREGYANCASVGVQPRNGCWFSTTTTVVDCCPKAGVRRSCRYKWPDGR